MSLSGFAVEAYSDDFWSVLTDAQLEEESEKLNVEWNVCYEKFKDAEQDFQTYKATNNVKTSNGPNGVVIKVNSHVICECDNVFNWTLYDEFCDYEEKIFDLEKKLREITEESKDCLEEIEYRLIH